MEVHFHAAEEDVEDSSELLYTGAVSSFAKMLNRSFSLELAAPLLCRLGVSGELVASDLVQPGDSLKVVDGCPSGGTPASACRRAARGLHVGLASATCSNKLMVRWIAADMLGYEHTADVVCSGTSERVYASRVAWLCDRPFVGEGTKAGAAPIDAEASAVARIHASVCAPWRMVTATPVESAVGRGEALLAEQAARGVGELMAQTPPTVSAPSCWARMTVGSERFIVPCAAAFVNGAAFLRHSG